MRYSMFKKLRCLLSLLGTFSLEATCNPYAIPTYETGYVPFTIVNNSGGIVANSNLYITITGTNPTTQSSCIVKLAAGTGGQWFGSLVDSAGNQNLFADPNPSTTYSYPISAFPVQNSQPVIYLPPIANATMYFSIAYGMGLNVSPGSPISIQPPQLFTTSDANYYHLYDNSTFFSIGTKLNVQSQYLNAFGLPVSAIVSSNNANGGMYASIQYSGMAVSRSTIFTNYANSITSTAIPNANSQAQWAKLPLSFTSASGSGVTQLRLASTLSAMNFPSSPFDPSYLINATYGLNWAQTVFGTTTPPPYPLYFDVSDLTTSGKVYNYYQYTGVSNGNLVFVPGPNSTGTNVNIPYPFTTSLPFLNAAGTGAGSFLFSGDSLAGPLICNYLSAGFVTGLFPVSSMSTGGVLTPINLFGNGYLAYANVNGQFYKDNPALTSGKPWYDLYGAVLHGAATPPYFNFQAEAVDSKTGYFSPIEVSNNSNTQPAVFVVLGDMTSTVVPNFTDATLYAITISPTPSAISYTFNGMGPYTGTMTFSSVSVPFTLQVTYQTGIYKNQTFTSEIWVNDTNSYSVVFPQPPTILSPNNTGSHAWNVGVGPSP